MLVKVLFLNRDEVSHLTHRVAGETSSDEDDDLHGAFKEERARCAFLRVWCLVELAAALAAGVPVVMLIGGADAAGGWAAAEKSRHDGAVSRFQDGAYHDVGYRPTMAGTLRYLVDVERAEATFASDVSLILDDRMPEILEVNSRAEATAA